MENYYVDGMLEKADVLLIVPPFAAIDIPPLGVNVLKSCAEQRGFTVEIAYTNIVLASLLGAENYKVISESASNGLGEVFFAEVAYGISLESRFGMDIDSYFKKFIKSPVDLNLIKDVFTELNEWVDKITTEFIEMDYKVIGCSTCFDQTSSSIAFINSIKRKKPEIFTIIGGANCEAEMAEGIVSLSNNIDYVFTGEGEYSFPNFLENVFNGILPEQKIIGCTKSMDLDQIPCHDYNSYFRQIEHFMPNTSTISLTYESSRGCWWGEKHQCTFCGLNGERTEFRQKSPDKVMNDLKRILKNHSGVKIIMVDNIMPYNYISTLIPSIKKEIPDISFHYELKSNMSLDQLILLKKAGAFNLQPGIEALSTSLLKRMNKGVIARMNVAFLRNSRSLELNVAWNLLYDFPQDIRKEYEETLELIPKIIHLQPPISLCKMVITRFSKYYNNPKKFGIKNIRPIECYHSFLPEGTDASKIAYNFTGEFEHFTNINQQILSEITHLVDRWKKLWNNEFIPILQIKRTAKNCYVLLDTRGLSNTKRMQMLTHKQAFAALVDRSENSVDGLEDEIQWALNHNLIIKIDSWYVSLVTAASELLLELKEENIKTDILITNNSGAHI
ncbi:RiPP maturation radical SAM C-methyltransferase [Clostridium sp. E02]|uniref:RiPP maturation radical SAM C-methyltransferase n=1 Tax=Clostridium sp. E02 TaxID=2487134 RepID=UPI0013DE0241|nr:RiPP maturation radical SAM C-methyltransferase [Clostridium sp. E02]